MERSLSVLLPVRNAQSTLAAILLDIMEILPELTGRFEVVIVDDGSDDGTVEVADEWSARYPQITVAFHTKPLGRAAAVKTGLELSSGEIILLRDENRGLAIEEVNKLWQAMGEHGLALARPGNSAGFQSDGWNRHHQGHRGGFQMVHRHAVQHIEQSIVDQETLMAESDQQGRRWHEVPVHGQSPRRSTRLSAARQRLSGRKRPVPTGPGRPNYLSRIKDFAFGE